MYIYIYTYIYIETSRRDVARRGATRRRWGVCGVGSGLVLSSVIILLLLLLLIIIIAIIVILAYDSN